MLPIERSPQGENKTAKSRFVHSASQQRIHFLTTESFIQIFYQHICFLHTALSGKAPKTPVQKVSHYLLKAFFRNPSCCYTKLLSHPSEGRLTRVHCITCTALPSFMGKSSKDIATKELGDALCSSFRAIEEALEQHMAGTDLLLKTTSSIIKKKKKHLNVIPKKLFITLLVWEESSRILLFFLWVELCSSFPIEANGHFCTCAKIINLLLCLTKGAY